MKIVINLWGGKNMNDFMMILNSKENNNNTLIVE